MPRGRKAATTATTSPEKPTPTRRTGRRAKEVEEIIPAHLLKASDESSENSDNDSDYGSPKKGGRGGRGGGGGGVGGGRGRGRRAKEAPVVEVASVQRPRRGRRAAVKDPSPEAEPQEQQQVDDQSQSTQEFSESTQEHPFESVNEPSFDESAGKVSEVSIEQDLHAYNDQGPVHEEEESVVETREKDVDESTGGQKDEDVTMKSVNDSDDVMEVNEVTQIDDSSEESNPAPTPTTTTTTKVTAEVVEEPKKEEETQQEIPHQSTHKVIKADEKVEVIKADEEKVEVAQEPEKPPNAPEVVTETRRSRKGSYRYPHMDAPQRSRSSSGEILEEVVEKPKQDEIPPEPPKKVVEEKTPSTTRKRKWGPRKNDDDPVIAITTDSLKTIISDEVKPVPLSDVKLLSTSPEREPEEKRQRVKLTAEDKDAKKKLLKERLRKQEEEEERRNEQLVKAIDKQVAANAATASNANGSGIFKDRKISIVMDDTAAVAPSPAKNESSNILYITNLVRPFTVLQLKSLLARTGKIVENGFWIDKIKSKCYVKYETEDEAVETRHALHGVTWPASNPKCLNVDFGREEDMEKSILSTLEEPRITITTENRDVREEKDFGWSKDPHKVSREEDRPKTSRPVREWDVGKNDKEDFDRDRNRGRRSAERDSRRERDRERDRDRERGDRDREKDEKRVERPESRRSVSESPGRKTEGDSQQPVRLLDDLFRKTKALPSIYWLPLNAEQIAEKEAQRQKNLAEHNRAMEEMKGKVDRDREKRRSVSRDRKRRSRSRSDRRRRNRSNSRDRRNRR